MRKLCPSCETEKDVSEFYKNARAKDGIQYQCKMCRNEYLKNWFTDYYINNKDIIEENFNIALKYKIAEDYLWDSTLSNYF
jgi:hypothetical protein